MLDIKPFIGGEFYESNISKKLSDYLLVYKLKSAKKTGTLMGMKTFSQLFHNLKADYYQLFIHRYEDKKLLVKNIGKYNRLEKIKKYYTEGYYEDIEDIIIQGGNQITPLLEALALWVDYDLIKMYYKGFDLEKIEKTLLLWCEHYYNYSEDKDLLSMKKRLNLPRFLLLLDTIMVPLIYKDGVLIMNEYSMFKDLSIYNTNSVEDAVKNIINKLLSKNLDLNDFLYDDFLYGENKQVANGIYAFPYVFVLGWTGYGYALNVYKFNPKSMGLEPVKYFMIERPFIGNEAYLEKIKFVNVNDISDMIYLINKLVKFWFDDEYMYYKAYSSGVIYKVKRSEVKLVRVDGDNYYFRIFGELIKINLYIIPSFVGLFKYAKNGY